MAKVQGPLLSLGGNGQIGKTVVFSRWRGVKYVRQYVVPANPDTAGQQSTRNTFKTMTTMWKVAPSLLKSAWDAFASGKKFTGLNAFCGQNIAVNRGQADFTNFIGSPGNAGGLPPDSVAAATGGASGEVDLTFVNPATPTDWTLESEIGVMFQDQDPELAFTGVFVSGENDPPTGAMTLTGDAATLYITAGFLKWTKPDGTTAYSPSVTDSATSAA